MTRGASPGFWLEREAVVLNAKRWLEREAFVKTGAGARRLIMNQQAEAKSAKYFCTSAFH